jgi:hypothetical protein
MVISGISHSCYSPDAVICRGLRTILDGHEKHFGVFRFGLRTGIAGSDSKFRVGASRITYTEASCSGSGWSCRG